MRKLRQKLTAGIALASLIVTLSPNVTSVKAEDQPGPGYSCTIAQETGTDKDFRVALSYCGLPHFNVSEAETGDPASTRSMQVSQGNGSYNISYITGVTTPDIRFLSLETNLYDGTKLQLKANSVTITDVHGVSTEYSIKNCYWTHRNGDGNAPYSLIIRDPNYFYPDADGKPSTTTVDAFGGKTIEIKALSKINLNFTVADASGDAYIGDVSTDTETFMAANGVKAAKTTASAGGIKKTGVKISWIKNNSAQGYHVYRSTDDNYYKLLKTVSQTSYTDTSVMPGQKYFYRVRAYGYSNGKQYLGGFSDASVVTISKTLATPSISAKKSGSKVKITIKKADGNKVQVQYKKGNSWKSLKAVSLKKTITCKISGKSVRVRTSIKTGGKTYTSSWSNKVNL